jgi:hypothetical protein
MSDQKNKKIRIKESCHLLGKTIRKNANDFRREKRMPKKSLFSIDSIQSVSGVN